MTQCIIENGIIVDDVNSVMQSIRVLSDTVVSDFEVIKKFILNEKHTRFYVDSKLNSSIQSNGCEKYLWLDTGCLDKRGEPVMLSLLKGNDGFSGHVVGTLYQLCRNVKDYFHIKDCEMQQKLEKIKRKIEQKSGERKNKYITSEKDFILDIYNSDETIHPFATKLIELGLTFDEEDVEEEIKENVNEELALSKEQEEITIGILFDWLEQRDKIIQELLDDEKNGKQKSQEELQRKQEECDFYKRQAEEYKRAMVDMRVLTNMIQAEEEEITPHSLIGRHRKILVIGGSSLGIDKMCGIAKSFGLARQDLEFYDYDQAKTAFDNIRRGGRYAAMILGPAPHSTKGRDGYTSAIEKFKTAEGMPFAVDARTKSGGLKLTKESFREALRQIYLALGKAA